MGAVCFFIVLIVCVLWCEALTAMLAMGLRRTNTDRCRRTVTFWLPHGNAPITSMSCPTHRGKRRKSPFQTSRNIPNTKNIKIQSYIYALCRRTQITPSAVADRGDGPWNGHDTGVLRTSYELRHGSCGQFYSCRRTGTLFRRPVLGVMSRAVEGNTSNDYSVAPFYAITNYITIERAF